MTTTTNTSEADVPQLAGYCRKHIQAETWTEIEAGAYRQLVKHLQDRNGAIQNMDLMTIGGFCRNCLAKWLVVEARKMSDSLDVTSDTNVKLKEALDAMGYDDAAVEVYGCAYPEWKKLYQKKATDEQMQRFNDSSEIHAKHDKALLKARSENLVSNVEPICLKPVIASSTQPSSLLSDVCCQDVDAVVTNNRANTTQDSGTNKALQQSSTVSGYQAPLPPNGGLDLKVGILTVSDRASKNEYTTGDLSGPAVDRAVENNIKILNGNSSTGVITCEVTEKSIVPDDVDKIGEILKQWSGKGSKSESCNLIFTTGGTGFAPRDVTPEATLAVLDCECRGLMSWVINECTAEQPLATLSRGTAGICGKSIIVNLPGNPRGVSQVMNLLFPLLVHAVKDMST